MHGRWRRTLISSAPITIRVSTRLLKAKPKAKLPITHLQLRFATSSSPTMATYCIRINSQLIFRLWWILRWASSICHRSPIATTRRTRLWCKPVLTKLWRSGTKRPWCRTQAKAPCACHTPCNRTKFRNHVPKAVKRGKFWKYCRIKVKWTDRDHWICPM